MPLASPEVIIPSLIVSVVITVLWLYSIKWVFQDAMNRKLTHPRIIASAIVVSIFLTPIVWIGAFAFYILMRPDM